MAEIELQNHGIRFFYRINRAERPLFDPVLFVSGAFQNMDSWKFMSCRFLPLATVVLADLPGIGDADPLPEDYGMDFLADSLDLILEAESIRRVYLVSASYGTPVAYLFAQRYPDKVGNLVLAGTMKEIPPHVRDRISKSVEIAARYDMKEFADFALNNGFLNCDADAREKINRQELVRKVMTMQLARMDEASVEKYVTNTNRLLRSRSLELEDPPRARTLVFTGEYDVFTTPEACREMAAAIGNSAFTTIRRADHLFHLEQPDTTNELVLRFIKRQPLEEIDGCNAIEYF